jgi:type I restriction enzyme M protein
MTQSIQMSERRTEHLLNDLLDSQGWDRRRPPQGDIVFQHEYRSFPELREALAKASKSGPSHGVPEAILIDRDSSTPIAVIETKPSIAEIDSAVGEAQGYAVALYRDNQHPLAVGLAGTQEDGFAVRVSKRVRSTWEPITYDNQPINWIPTRADLVLIATPTGPTEIRPSIPPIEVLAARADEINRLLRESRIKDEFRPAVVAAVMLALWHSRGEIRRDARYILGDINRACRDAFIKAGRTDLASSLRVEEANDKLREKARRIATILERLNVTVLTAEHDYLGHLYETFFRYTGGNTIGQYFTPRHITKMMADVCEVTKDDIVLDPACGTGGFLISCMDRIARIHHLSRRQMVSVVQRHLIGFEDEPTTAALCIANMILRGDGSTGVHRADCFRSPDYPKGRATVGLMNPPFPHEDTDESIEKFVECALSGLKNRGKLAVIMKTSLLAKKDKGAWRQRILENNTLLAVCHLPDELFQPFASVTTAFVILEKGIPHNPRRKTMFVRLHHDGLTLRKGTRVERLTEPNQIPDAVDAILNHTVVPGFSAAASVSQDDEWSPGAYIASVPADPEESKVNVDVLLRRLASFYARYAAEIVSQRRAISSEEIEVRPYREVVSEARRTISENIPASPGTIGGLFDIFYGMKELHSREGFASGRSLVIAPTEQYNGCYGWLDYPTLITSPFVTVAQTGSIGEAFVQIEPCAVNDDCLVLLPKEGVGMADLVLAAAALRSEKWRFGYGRKLTPSRIAAFRVPDTRYFAAWLNAKLRDLDDIIAASLSPYQTEDERDSAIAGAKLKQIAADPSQLVLGDDVRLKEFKDLMA